MRIPIYHLDAFATNLFQGNPAAVCVLDKWLPDPLLQSIAAENYLPATTFLVRDGTNYSTRWFTPEYEIDLCGHGTLALGHVFFHYLEPEKQTVELHSPAGPLTISRQDDLITLNFPVKSLEACAISDLLIQGLGAKPKEVYQHQSERCLAIFDNEEQIQMISPNMAILKQLGYRGIIVTAIGNIADFVSRVFYPHKLLSEDAVTGSSHCLLVPYWSSITGKRELHSRQLSERGGDLFCELRDGRITISGKVTLYMQGTLDLARITGETIIA